MNIYLQRLWAERAVRAVSNAFPIVAYSNWPSCERLIQQAKTLSKLISEFNFAFPEAAEMLNRAGRYLKDRGLYNEAETILKQSLDIYEKATSDESKNSANVLLELAGICRILGRHKEAEAQYKRCLTIRATAFGVGHPEIAPVLNNLAIVYERQGKYSDAESLYNRSIQIYENARNPDGEGHAAAHNNLAQLLQTLARHDEAEALYKRALNLKTKVVGDEHPGAAEILANLARLYTTQGRFAEAEPLYIRCLKVLESVLGAEHLDVANTLTNFADTYREQGRYEEAESLYLRALAIYEKTLGPIHPDLATVNNNLGLLYHSQDRYDLAKRYYKRSLKIHEEAESADSIDYAVTLNNLADIYQTTGSLTDAKPLYERSLIMLETTLGPEHSDVIEVKNNYSMLLDEIRSGDVFISQKIEDTSSDILKIEQPVKVFYSYAQEDADLVEELIKHFSALKRAGFIESWYDRQINAGAEWKDMINERLEAAGIILLLVSSDFLASDYCYNEEMKRAMERHESREARVIPIILRMCDWTEAPFGKLQALPKNGRAIKSWGDRDEAFTDIVAGIKRVIQEMNRPPQLAPRPHTALNRGPDSGEPDKFSR